MQKIPPLLFTAWAPYGGAWRVWAGLAAVRAEGAGRNAPPATPHPPAPAKPPRQP